MVKAVVDTHIFVSSLLSSEGAAAAMITAWRDRGYVLCTSPAIMAEIAAVLSRPRLRDKYALSDAIVDDLMSLLEREALIAPGRRELPEPVLEDPTDTKSLACAIEADADFIVSGDHRLLDLCTYAGIKILTVRAFMHVLRAGLSFQVLLCELRALA